MKLILPCLGTILGIVLGIATIVIWMSTFSVNYGGDYSPVLFPVMSAALRWNNVYQPLNLPFGLWYWGAFLNWFLLGVSVDLLCWAFRFCRQSQTNMKTFGRWLALMGVGWAVVMPVFLYWRVPYDGGSEKFDGLEREIWSHIYPGSHGHVTRGDLENQIMEIRIISEKEHWEAERFAFAITISSVGLVILSGFVLRTSRRDRKHVSS
jgi:hypothetical protein